MGAEDSNDGVSSLDVCNIAFVAVSTKLGQSISLVSGNGRQGGSSFELFVTLSDNLLQKQNPLKKLNRNNHISLE